MSDWGKAGLFFGGVLAGTAGIKLLCSKDAKKVYTHTTAAVLRVRECVMTAATTVRENAEDILADAKAINEKRAAETCAEDISDTSETSDIPDTSAEPETEAAAG